MHQKHKYRATHFVTQRPLSWLVLAAAESPSWKLCVSCRHGDGVVVVLVKEVLLCVEDCSSHEYVVESCVCIWGRLKAQSPPARRSKIL